jgi:cell division protein FtsA
LDIGSKTVTLAAARNDAADPLAGLVVETQPAQGIFKGVVNDLAGLSDVIANVADRIREKTGQKVLQASVAINGNYVTCRRSRVAMALSERGTRAITRRDLAALSEQARLLGTELDEHLIREVSQGYSIDRHPMTRSPLGLHGRRLETEVLVVAAPHGHIDNVVKAAQQVGIDVTQVHVASLATAEAVLSPEEKERGVVLVDIGDTLTGIAVFKGGLPLHLRVLSFGGRDLTEIIANYCHVTMEVAEGIARASLEIDAPVSESDAVMIRAEGMFRPVSKRDLAAVVVAEMDKFVALAHDAVAQSGVGSSPGMSVVVTGGPALVEGLLEKLEKDLSLPVRLGVPRGMAHIAVSRSVACAAAAGLVLLSFPTREAAAPLLLSEPKNRVVRWVEGIRHMYQDYF